VREFPASLREMIVSLWRNRELIYASTKREVLGRYRGSVLGLFWSFFNPLFMLAVYTVVFSEIFKARWSADSGSKAEFALVLFAGLIVFNLFAECFNRAPTLITSNPNYVKKVVYPLEVLPFIVLLSALYHAAVSLAVWLIAYTFLIGVPHVTVLYLPAIIVPLIFFIMGLTWIVASLGTFLRDVSQLVAVLTSVLMFLSPIFYPTTALPPAYRTLLYLNPLTLIVECARDFLFWGRVPNIGLLGMYWLLALVFAWMGFAWFQKTRKGFADVI